MKLIIEVKEYYNIWEYLFPCQQQIINNTKYPYYSNFQEQNYRPIRRNRICMKRPQGMTYHFRINQICNTSTNAVDVDAHNKSMPLHERCPDDNHQQYRYLENVFSGKPWAYNTFKKYILKTHIWNVLIFEMSSICSSIFNVAASSVSDVETQSNKSQHKRYRIYLDVRSS